MSFSSLCWPLWWSRGFIHPPEASLDLPQHQICVAEHGGPACTAGKELRMSLSSHACLDSQSNMCFQQQLWQNIYFAHCNLSREPCVILLSMLSCLLTQKFRSLLPCDIYIMQSQLFHSSACYFEWKEPLSPLPSGLRQVDYLACGGAAWAEVFFGPRSC